MTDSTALFDVGVPQPRKDAAAAGAVETVIDEACRTLHLSTIRSRWEELAATALKERATFKDFLADLLEAECLQREERKKARLVREANFPRPKRLEDFEFDKNPNIVQEQRVSWTGSQNAPRSCMLTVFVDCCPSGEHRVLAQVPYRDAVQRFGTWLAETAPAVAAAAGPDRTDDLPARVGRSSLTPAARARHCSERTASNPTRVDPEPSRPRVFSQREEGLRIAAGGLRSGVCPW
ncbi:ATP-binding protein [Streptomyces collinus]|uniref:ATP-binding protein n=1 Tax=Streptomyces collinus TaxID=42684 RepID=UPI00367EC2F5